MFFFLLIGVKSLKIKYLCSTLLFCVIIALSGNIVKKQMRSLENILKTGRKLNSHMSK
jgi:hypothetical protein